MNKRERYLRPEYKKAIGEAEQRGYNNPEVAEIEDSMRDVVEGLRQNIDAGVYDTLISDDVGGRIPTPILRKIIKERSPEDIETYFVPAGHALPGREGGPISDKGKNQLEMLIEGLKKIDTKKKVLVVTQLSHTGATVRELQQLLVKAGIDAQNIDFAILSGPEGSDSHFIGKHGTGIFAEMHAPVSGVSKVKSEDGTIKLERRSTHLKDIGVEGEVSEDYLLWQQYTDAFGLRTSWGSSLRIDMARKKQNDPKKLRRYERKVRRPLTDEQVVEMNKRVASAREDVKTMAVKLSNEIWGEEQQREAA